MKIISFVKTVTSAIYRVAKSLLSKTLPIVIVINFCVGKFEKTTIHTEINIDKGK